jgi:hypothetical protein
LRALAALLLPLLGLCSFVGGLLCLHGNGGCAARTALAGYALRPSVAALRVPVAAPSALRAGCIALFFKTIRPHSFTVLVALARLRAASGV